MIINIYVSAAAAAAVQLFLGWKNDPPPSFIIFSAPPLPPQFINKQLPVHKQTSSQASKLR